MLTTLIFNSSIKITRIILVTIFVFTVLISAVAFNADYKKKPIVSRYTGEAISIASSRCFGPCPVFEARVTPDDVVHFTGREYTSTLGYRELPAVPGINSAVADALARWRPETGQVEDTVCDEEATDHSTLKFTWQSADGTLTVLRHDLGCWSDENTELKDAAFQMLRQIGIEELIRHSTPNL